MTPPCMFTTRHPVLLAIVHPMQVEINPYITRTELAKYCREHGIAVQAYSPLAKAQRMSDPPLVAMAAKYQLTPAQIMIRWCLQRGYIVIPKCACTAAPFAIELLIVSHHASLVYARRSVTPARIEANARLGDVDISEVDMAALDALDCYLVTGWDPTKDP